MTTWTNSVISRRKDLTMGGSQAKIYTLVGVSGDTGGTLTTKFTNIEYASVLVYKSDYSAGVAATAVISGNTVVVAYSDPAAGHQIKILVVQG